MGYQPYPLVLFLRLDLSLVAWGGDPIEDIDGQPVVVRPKSADRLSESLCEEGMDYVISRLFPLCNGIHFRKLDLRLICGEDIFEIAAIVERCCFALESLEVCIGHYDMFTYFSVHYNSLFCI